MWSIFEEIALCLQTDQKAWKNGTVGSAIIVAKKQQHIAITGKGTVDGCVHNYCISGQSDLISRLSGTVFITHHDSLSCLVTESVTSLKKKIADSEKAVFF